MEIKLKKTWKLGDQIGRGGFGKVYHATSDSDSKEYAVKLVPKTEGTSREQLFVDINNAKNVLPIIESGETATDWVLVMPLAEKSLQDEIDNGAVLTSQEIVKIMKDVTEALVSIEGKVVHRDLKPANILFYETTWRLADFGISRYAEASTASDTKKHALSAPYAGPERWRDEHADIKTDVYSLGVVGYKLLAGKRPFQGPSREDYRKQHIQTTPTRIDGVNLQLADLILECLYKPTQARPQPANILARLEQIQDKTGRISLPSLQAANSDEVTRISEEQAQRSAAQAEQERREGLFQHANDQLIDFSNTLADTIIENASTASITNRVGPSWLLQLNKARLHFSPITRVNFLDWDSGHKPVIDVIATANIALSSEPDHIGYKGQSHSLWFCDAKVEGEYAWYETAFSPSVFSRTRESIEPFALEPGKDAAAALSMVMGTIDVAVPFRKIDNESLPSFIEDWANDLAASKDRYRKPAQNNSHGSWRR